MTTPLLHARELVLSFLVVEDKKGIDPKNFTTYQLKELFEAIEYADFGRDSQSLNRMRIKVMAELLLRGETVDS